MAKMFYTLEETKNALNADESEIKQYTREGRLREFRDGPRLMFKYDQVESLKDMINNGDLGPVPLGEKATLGPLEEQAVISDDSESSEPQRAPVGKRDSALESLLHAIFGSAGGKEERRLHRAYTSYESSELWAVIEKAVNDLVANKDLIVTDHYNVVGYIVKELTETAKSKTATAEESNNNGN